MSILYIEHLNHANGGKQLYQNATMKINRGEHIALIGPNGCGKTTLLNIITGHLGPDRISMKLFPYVKMGYLDQHQEVNNEITTYEYLRETYAHLFAKEEEINNLYSQMTQQYEEKLLTKALKLQEELDHSDFNDISKKINNLISGLNINRDLLDHKLVSLSGGQRSKVLLAKLLLSENDFLLLDEPTNFLDIEQVNWLAKFLQSYPNAFLLVSHDRDFINKTANIIYAIDNLSIDRYVGNFETYLEANELRRNQYLSDYKGQKKEIERLKTYVAKNIARSSTAKSAKSRQKKLDKMTILSPPKNIQTPKFNFKYKKPSATNVVVASNLEIGYAKSLIKPLTFKIRDGEKWLVSGHNGVGKTTFLQTLSQIVKPISGHIEIGDNVIIGYFKQIEEFTNITPIEYLRLLNPQLNEKNIRIVLASFAVKKDLVMQKMSQLSGGEQTKVRLASLSLKPCSLLILDEPTNHLDNLAKDSLLKAIADYEGTVLITTHDTNFSTIWADNVLNFEDFT